MYAADNFISLAQVGETSVGSVLQSHMYRQLATQELFLCSDGQFRGLSNGYVLDTSNMDMQVRIAIHFSKKAQQLSTNIFCAGNCICATTFPCL